MTLIHAYAVYLFLNLEAGWHMKQETGQPIVRAYGEFLVLLSRKCLARHSVLICLNTPTNVELKTIKSLLVLEIRFKYMAPCVFKILRSS
jgi:hypothetical protein